VTEGGLSLIAPTKGNNRASKSALPERAFLTVKQTAKYLNV